MIGTLQDSNNKWHYINSRPVTEQEGSELKNIYLGGQCLALAVALAEKHKCAIITLHDGPSEPAHHAWALTTPHIIQDITGQSKLASIKADGEHVLKITKVKDFKILEAGLPIQNYNFARRVVEENHL